jgi:hypothetical protein
MLVCALNPAGAAGAEQGACLATTQVAIQQDGALVTRTDQERFEVLYAEADCLRKSAARQGFEWLKTEEILLRSRQAADKGDLGDASQLLQTARLQAEAALQQAEAEALAWKHRVPGYGESEH